MPYRTYKQRPAATGPELSSAVDGDDEMNFIQRARLFGESIIHHQQQQQQQQLSKQQDDDGLDFKSYFFVQFLFTDDDGAAATGDGRAIKKLIPVEEIWFRNDKSKNESMVI